MVPAAPPTRKNQRATSCPAPISANVPYLPGSRLICSAFWSVATISRFISGELSTKRASRRACISPNPGYCRSRAVAARPDAREPERPIHFCKTGTNGLVRAPPQRRESEDGHEGESGSNRFAKDSVLELVGCRWSFDAL